jgi:3-dehydroquinate synthase
LFQHKITIAVARIKSDKYTIYVGALSETIVQSGINFSSYSKIFVLVDENTNAHCWPYLMYSVSGLEHAELIEIPSGEPHKTLEICYQLWATLTEVNADRKSLMINLGGGVIGDMGGFVASTYKRGIDFIQIPTTLLSQVDASVGGKLGIDFEGYKNQIGVFNNPKAVFIDAAFLETLDARNLRSGFAEMLKHALIADAAQWQKLKALKQLKHLQLSKFITSSVRIKNNIVKQDFTEQGLRKILNFGHTIGHAIESALLNSPDSLLHGEAIAMGMVIEAILSKHCGLSDDEQNDILNVLQQHFSLFPIEADLQQKVMEYMKQDKKNQASNINFSLLNAIGSSQFDCFMSESQILQAISDYNRLVQ